MPYGYTHDEEGDIQFVAGDFAKGDTTNEIIQDTMLQVAGDDKLNPTIGVGVRAYLGSSGSGLLTQSIKEQLKYQGINVRKVNYDSTGKIDIGL